MTCSPMRRPRSATDAPRERALLTLELALERDSCGDSRGGRAARGGGRAAARKAGDHGTRGRGGRPGGRRDDRSTSCGTDKAEVARAEAARPGRSARRCPARRRARRSSRDPVCSLPPSQLYAVTDPAGPAADRGRDLLARPGRASRRARSSDRSATRRSGSGELESRPQGGRATRWRARSSPATTRSCGGVRQLSAWVAVAQGRASDAIADAELAVEAIRSSSSSSAADARRRRLASGDPKWQRSRPLESSGWVDPGLPPTDRLRALEVTVRAHLARRRTEEAGPAGPRGRPEEAAGQLERAPSGRSPALIEAQVCSLGARRSQLPEPRSAGAGAAREADAPLWEGRCRTLAGEAPRRRGKGGRRPVPSCGARPTTWMPVARRATATRRYGILRRLGERRGPRPRRRSGRRGRRARRAYAARARGCGAEQYVSRNQ